MKTGEGMKKSNKVVVIVALLFAVVGIGGSIYFYLENQSIKNDPNTLIEMSKKATSQEAKELKDKVSKLMQLPSDEEPVVATVSDKDKLKDQPFFKNAANGDKILIFTVAKKAIIYRESEDRLINVGPIAVASTNLVAVSVLGKNSTDSAIEKLKSVSGISTTGGKSVNSRDKTAVYDVSGSNSTLASQIATAVDGEVVTSLPDGETAPAGAGIVVFIAD